MKSQPASALQARSFQSPSRARGFTLVELLVVITIIAALASLVFMLARRSLDTARTSTSVSNLHQLHTGIMSFAAENSMNLPVNYFSSNDLPKGSVYPRDRIWYNAICKYLYPSIYEKASVSEPWPWSKNTDGYLNTVLLSPNAENGHGKTPSSYGYNVTFDNKNAPYTYSSRYDAARTCMLADNSGKTHTLAPRGETDSASINARNGASGAFKRDGKAVVLFLDGHVDTISAQRAKQLNSKTDDPFWGVEP